MVTPHPLIGLRAIRRVRHASIADIAEIVGVAPTSYSRFEAGTRRIYLDKALTLASKLGVRVEDLGKPLDEQDALRLCDERDKAALAAGTFNPMLWRAPDEPATAPPPPPQAAAMPPPPPPVDRLPDALEDWNVG